MRRMSVRPALVLCLGAPLGPWATALPQLRQSLPIDDPSAAEPPEGVSRQTIAGGPVRFVAIENMDDSVPMPGVRYEEGPAGPEVHVPEDANPFALGFAAGSYAPPLGERLDPRLTAAAAAAGARGAQVTYAFAMLSKRMTRERLARLEAHGARFLGMHPHYAAKLAIPTAGIGAIADLDFVRWLGVPRPWQKLHPRLTARLAEARAGERHHVWVTVHESDRNPASTFDYIGTGAEVSPGTGETSLLPPQKTSQRWQSNGWQQQGLEDAGAVIELYEDSITAFRCTLDAAGVERVRDLDFVQFVESVESARLMHDESQPMCAVDLTRPFNSGGTFGDAVVGEVDSGIERDHSLLNHQYGIGWDLSNSATGAWGDPHGHGTHVAGTFFGGDWSGHEAQYGAAPGLGSSSNLRIFNVKYFDDFGNGSGAPFGSIFDRMHASYTDFGGMTTPYPHIVSNSWGSGAGAWFGTEANARLVDNEVYIYSQLYTFAAGNSGPGLSTLSQQASAKNAFSVGNVYPYGTGSIQPDDIRFNSSRGPCGDGRWKPNVVAPGTGIQSADSANTSGLATKSGTSMATPHVSGIAAQLVDRYDFLQYNPAVLSAVLMATALTKTNHTAETDGHLDTYGTGRVSAYRAIGGNSYSLLAFWAFDQPETSTVELDFEVFPGATRLTAVLTYHELAGSPGASLALVNDVDMVIDRFPFSSAGNVGEFTAQISAINNTEVRTIDNPSAAAYRIKSYPRDVPPLFGPKVGVCVLVEYGDTTPIGTLGLSASEAYVQPNQPVEIVGSVTNQANGSTAQSVYLESSSASMQLSSVRSFFADGAVSELSDNVSGGMDVMLGDMRHGQTRVVAWQGSWASEGSKTFTVNTVSPNFTAAQAQATVIVDGTGPALPADLAANGLAVGEHSCDLSVTMDWDPATDALSGVAGYSTLWDHNPVATPNATNDGSATTRTTTLSADQQPWYFHVRAIDNAGNAGSTAHAGPYFLGTASSTSVCNTNANSTGQPASLATTGQLCLAEGALTLHTTGVPPNQFGYYIFGESAANVPFFGGSQGVLCIGAPIIRLNGDILNSGGSGTMTLTPDLENLPLGTTFEHGSTWYFQLWFRDNNPGPTSNTSNGIRVDWD